MTTILPAIICCVQVLMPQLYGPGGQFCAAECRVLRQADVQVSGISLNQRREVAPHGTQVQQHKSAVRQESVDVVKQGLAVIERPKMQFDINHRNALQYAISTTQHIQVKALGIDLQNVWRHKAVFDGHLVERMGGDLFGSHDVKPFRPVKETAIRGARLEQRRTSWITGDMQGAMFRSLAYCERNNRHAGCLAFVRCGIETDNLHCATPSQAIIGRVKRSAGTHEISHQWASPKACCQLDQPATLDKFYPSSSSKILDSHLAPCGFVSGSEYHSNRPQRGSQ